MSCLSVLIVPIPACTDRTVPCPSVLIIPVYLNALIVPFCVCVLIVPVPACTDHIVPCPSVLSVPSCLRCPCRSLRANTHTHTHTKRKENKKQTDYFQIIANFQSTKILTVDVRPKETGCICYVLKTAPRKGSTSRVQCALYLSVLACLFSAGVQRPLFPV